VGKSLDKNCPVEDLLALKVNESNLKKTDWALGGGNFK
jgi:hypothetical protein